MKYQYMKKILLNRFLFQALVIFPYKSMKCSFSVLSAWKLLVE